VGQVIGEEEKAEALVATMQARLRAVAERVGTMATRPHVLFWGPQGYTGGRLTSMDDLITHAGGENLAAIYGMIGSANLSAEQVVAMNPQVIIGGGDTRHPHPGLDASLMHPAFQTTDALQQGNVYTLPMRYLVTISQCIVDGVEELARVLRTVDRGAGRQ
jgi:iron complex transport system substrate-binding protein